MFKRPKIPREIEDTILFASRHTCNKCHITRKNVQIHHIDGNNTNNKPTNLIVLCLDCHSEVTGRSLGKSYTRGELLRYKVEWEMMVRLTPGNLPNEVEHMFPAAYLSKFENLGMQSQYKEPDINSEKEIGTQGIGNPQRLHEIEEMIVALHGERHYIHTLADYLLESGQFEIADSVFKHIYDTDLKNRDYALSNRAEALESLGKPEEAIKVVKKAVEREPQNSDAKLLLAQIHFKNRHIELAIEHAKAVLDKQPDNASAMLLVGDAYLQKHDLDNAIVYHEKILRLRPTDAEALWHTGVIYCRKNDHAKALDYFQRGHALHPNDLNFLFSIGLESEHVGNYPQAITYFDKCHQVAPNDTRVLGAKGALYCNKLDDHKKALETFHKALTISSNDSKLLYGKALELDHLYDYGEAIKFYDKAIQSNPRNTKAIINKGVIIDQIQNSPREALLCYRKAIKLRPEKSDLVVALNNTGKCLISLRKYNSALRSLDHALKLEPDDYFGLVYRAVALAKLKRTNDAKQTIQKILMVHPNSGKHLKRLWQTFHRTRSRSWESLLERKS